MDVRIIKARLDHIQKSSVSRRWPVNGWQARTADFTSVGVYQFDGQWFPIDSDSQWPAARTVFLKTTTAVPADARLEDLCLLFEFDEMEGLLSVNGQPYAGLDRFHNRVPVPAGDMLNLEMEFICHWRASYKPELREEKARFRRASFVQVDREVEAAYFDLRFAWEAASVLRDERRRLLVERALEEALLCIDLTAPAAEYRQQVLEARRDLASALAQVQPDPEGGRIFLAGHTHIDIAWLWPLRETVRKTARTFSTACRLMEQYPNFTFTCSQPQLYETAKENFPTLYEEVKGWVKSGRWEATGVMWLEADCNVTSGESLIRQVLHGTRFYAEEFGVRPSTCWLPDVFGYPASLPSILSGCGLKNFLTNKLHWQAKNVFPYALFWWEGIDGSRILAHIPRTQSYYNGWPNPEQLAYAWEHYAQKDQYPELLLSFGYGDGGGGVTYEMMEFANRASAGFPGLPAARQGPGEEYFATVHARQPELPTWVGELYLETHRGTYTTHGEIKSANRKNELLLRDAEIFASYAAMGGRPVDLSSLRPAWKKLLLLQFHDILPGSSIGEVYQEAAVDHAEIQRAAQSVRTDALCALSAGTDKASTLSVHNSLSWQRNDIAEATVRAAGLHQPLVLSAPDGETTPVQVLSAQDEELYILFPLHDLPASGYRVYTLQQSTGQAQASLFAEPGWLENRFFLLEFAPDGTITRLLDKRFNREVLPPGARANELQLFQDGPETEAAWNIHDTFSRRSYAWEGDAELRVIEQGPVRAVVRMVKKYRQSRIEQDIILYNHLPRIDFVTRAHWEERQVLLKAAFPVAVRSPRATFEIQYGAVERATHENTTWEQQKFEVCAHHWADLSEAGYGVSLLNDCKYGHDVRGNVLRITLLRGPESPDPDADRGDHQFTYALLPHAGSWDEGETVRRGWELNVPVVTTSGGLKDGMPLEQSFITVTGPAILDTVKPAEDGQGWILRLYEPHGGRGPVKVNVALGLTQVLECNHIEEPKATLPVEENSFGFDLHPFEVKTFRIQFPNQAAA